MTAVLASIVLLFAGDTGTESHPLPQVTGPDVCVSVEIVGHFEHGAEAWGENLLSGWYDSHAQTVVGWSLTSGGVRFCNGRLRGEIDLAGAFADLFDGSLDFAGLSGQTAAVGAVDACSMACRPAVACGSMLSLHARVTAQQTTSWGYLFRPGVVAETHLTTLMDWRYVARVTVE